MNTVLQSWLFESILVIIHMAQITPIPSLYFIFSLPSICSFLHTSHLKVVWSNFLPLFESVSPSLFSELSATDHTPHKSAPETKLKVISYQLSSRSLAVCLRLCPCLSLSLCLSPCLSPSMWGWQMCVFPSWPHTNKPLTDIPSSHLHPSPRYIPHPAIPPTTYTV